MPAERQIYLLDPQKLSPETIAVTFAKTSRSPQTFHEIAAELTDEKSAEFHEKWVVGYGHASVAEHAVLHVALENISRLAVETLESNRLASYTEKSTRYQKWDPQGYYRPAELAGHALEDLFVTTCQNLFDTYQRALPAVRAVVMEENPRREGESDGAWERRIRSEYVDVCRFLLPSASLANVGMTINARALEHAISKLLSAPLEEVRAIGAEVKNAAQAEVPTLVKYAAPLPVLERARQAFGRLPGNFPSQEDEDWFRLVDYDADGEKRVLAAALYRFGEMSFLQACAAVGRMNPAERNRLAGALLDGLGRHEIPLRELEYTRFTVDLLIDQGGYFEVKRHRMMTQTAQPLTARLGYALPRRIVKAGLEDAYRECMESARQAYEALAEYNPEVASYVVPNGFNRRVLLSFNLRSGLHFIRLRSAENAHFSVRRAAGRIAEQIASVSPLFGDFIDPVSGETWQQVEKAHFSQVC